MKTNFLALFALALMVLSWNKSNHQLTERKTIKHNLRKSFPKPTGGETTDENIGEWHNYLLDQLLPATSITPITTQFVLDSFFTYTDDVDFESEDIESINSTTSGIYLAIKDNGWMTYYCNLLSTSQVHSELNEDDSIALDALTVILTNDYGSGNEAVEDLITDLENLESTYTGSNSLILGTFRAGISSAFFWEYYVNVNQGDVDDDLYIIIQADAAGYIVGWTKGWLIDELTTSDGRIKAGIGGAFAASGMFGLKKRFGF